MAKASKHTRAVYDPKERRLHFVPEDDALYKAKEAADFFGMTKNSLMVSRCKGRLPGLPVVRLGCRVLFRGKDLKAYVERNLDSTGLAKPQSPRLHSPGRPPKKRKVA